jgi:ABC-2 type transport system permease protein
MDAARPSVVARYGRLFGVQVRMSAVTAMQYRADFLVRGFVTLLWMSVTLLPIVVVFGARKQVAGWSFPETLVVVGWFALVRAVLEGGVSPSLTAVVEHVRKGTLDFVLMKPADAQFLVSTARFAVWRAVNTVTALAIFAWGFRLLGRAPSPAAIALAVVSLVSAVAILYSLWIVTVSAAFYVVRIDNLSYFFNAIFDAARWPVSIFRGITRFMFTFVVPLGIMTTYPAQALLGTLRVPTLLGSLAAAAVALVLSRAVWTASIARYTSAGG